MSFFEYEAEDRLYLKSDLFTDNKIKHGFTTRLGGVSRGVVSGFNLGFRVADKPEAVRENYRLLSKDLDIDINKIVLSKQTHTDNIRLITRADEGKGVVRESDIEDTDGLITNVPGIALVIFSADCVPILMCDEDAGVVAAVHSGWRGSIKGIAPKCVEMMKNNYGCKAENIKVAIGPSIGPCCFEFGKEAVEYFGEGYCRREGEDTYRVDLWKYNFDRLTEAGIAPSNIDISRVCTYCESDKYYSYRKHKEKTGRLAGIISLNGG